MRAFILRRIELVSQSFGNLALLGSTHSPDTLRIKEFLPGTVTHSHTSISIAMPACKSCSIAFTFLSMTYR